MDALDSPDFIITNVDTQMDELRDGSRGYNSSSESKKLSRFPSSCLHTGLKYRACNNSFRYSNVPVNSSPIDNYRSTYGNFSPSHWRLTHGNPISTLPRNFPMDCVQNKPPVSDRSSLVDTSLSLPISSPSYSCQYLADVFSLDEQYVQDLYDRQTELTVKLKQLNTRLFDLLNEELTLTGAVPEDYNQIIARMGVKSNTLKPTSYPLSRTIVHRASTIRSNEKPENISIGADNKSEFNCQMSSTFIDKKCVSNTLPSHMPDLSFHQSTGNSETGVVETASDLTERGTTSQHISAQLDETSDLERAAIYIRLRRLELDHAVQTHLRDVHKQRAVETKLSAYRSAYKSNSIKLKDISAQIDVLKKHLDSESSDQSERKEDAFLNKKEKTCRYSIYQQAHKWGFRTLPRLSSKRQTDFSQHTVETSNSTPATPRRGAIPLNSFAPSNPPPSLTSLSRTSSSFSSSAIDTSVDGDDRNNVKRPQRLSMLPLYHFLKPVRNPSKSIRRKSLATKFRNSANVNRTQRETTTKYNANSLLLQSTSWNNLPSEGVSEHSNVAYNQMNKLAHTGCFLDKCNLTHSHRVPKSISQDNKLHLIQFEDGLAEGDHSSIEKNICHQHRLSRSMPVLNLPFAENTANHSSWTYPSPSTSDDKKSTQFSALKPNANFLLPPHHGLRSFPPTFPSKLNTRPFRRHHHPATASNTSSSSWSTSGCSCLSSQTGVSALSTDSCDIPPATKSRNTPAEAVDEIEAETPVRTRTACDRVRQFKHVRSATTVCESDIPIKCMCSCASTQYKRDDVDEGVSALSDNECDCLVPKPAHRARMSSIDSCDTTLAASPLQRSLKEHRLKNSRSSLRPMQLLQRAVHKVSTSSRISLRTTIPRTVNTEKKHAVPVVLPSLLDTQQIDLKRFPRDHASTQSRTISQSHIDGVHGAQILKLSTRKMSWVHRLRYSTRSHHP